MIPLETAKKHRSLEAGDIFWHFCKDTLLSGAVLAIFAGATLLLQQLAHFFEEDDLKHAVIEFLEQTVFFCGSMTVLVIVAYVTIVTVYDLVISFGAVTGLYKRKSD